MRVCVRAWCVHCWSVVLPSKLHVSSRCALGGAAARAHGGGSSPALIFPEMTHTEHVPAGWYPQFVDYLAFSFSTATAFSPTDVSAVKRWAKALVVCESLLSLVLAALVIARAINVLQ